MDIHLHLLMTDWLVWSIFLLGVLYAIWAIRQPHLREPWSCVFRSRLAMVALVILGFYITTGLLDSIHLQVTSTSTSTSQPISKIKSVLDLLLSPLGQEEEKTYSKPFATHLYTQSLVSLPNGKEIRTYPRLKYGGALLKYPQKELTQDIRWRIYTGFTYGLISILILMSFLILFVSFFRKKRFLDECSNIIKGKTRIAWREALITFALIWIGIAIASQLATAYHIFGTDKIGRDVFYEAIKSIRTGLLIGTLTTVFMLPFALILGTTAGYFQGWVDDIIQYLYTTLSSIPGVLLISAMVLVLQVYISNHAALFPTLIQRADARLLALCFILGITSWANLCRLLRAETLKLRELDYIQAARALGVRKPNIIVRHIIPNVMHIVIITLVLDFSGLVLAEAVLSYVGVGVDPTTMSWGNMINSSRLELAREPVVWWSLLAALIFMFGLVLAANLFADKVRDAFDPRV